MRVGFQARNVSDINSNPTGGVVVGTGFTIAWQDGPLGRDENRAMPNGAFVEDVIDACVQRLRFFQDSKFASPFNEAAIDSLKSALKSLDARTANRETRGVEGTHSV